VFALRTFAIATVVLVWVAGPAAAANPLAHVDNDLNLLCQELSEVPSPAQSISLRARLAELWRQREAILADLTADEEDDALRTSALKDSCGKLAELAFEQSHPKKKKKKKKAMKKKHRKSASKNGTGVAVDVSTELQPFFPWPPPAPSDRRLLALAQLGGTLPATWGDVADRLMALLRDGGFSTWGFYSAPGGFALIPRLEQLDDETGKALTGDARWAVDVRVASLGFFQRLTAVRLPKGAYRAFVFVLTTDPSSGGAITDAVRMFEIAKRWGTSGAADLPQAVRANRISDDQRLFLLLYEFESEVGGETTANTTARWSLDHHLRDAGIAIRP
jgi:hypothetical protein